MEQMTGTCMYCGQTRLVYADTQDRADMIATEECGACDNPIKKTKQLFENLDSLLGERAIDYGMPAVEEETLEVIKDAGCQIINGNIEAATFKVKGTTVSIRGTAVTRKKITSARLEV